MLHAIFLLASIEVIIDFLPRNYSFAEGVDGNVNLTLSVISGRIGREVVVSLHTREEDSATSIYVLHVNLCILSIY